MVVVIDTSITLAWLLPDERSPQAIRVLEELLSRDDELLAPQLWVLETANVLVSAARRSRITEADVARGLEVLGRLPVQLDDQPLDRPAIVATAMRHGLSAYDAGYLVLASRTGAALASLDARLLKAARDAGVTVLP